jgi:hypothetical protein
MKVICIDARETSLLEEGKVYDATEGDPSINLPNYFIYGINHPLPYYAKLRFIPLSEIDEMELVNENSSFA